jgi:hypothetical protein
MRQETGVGRKKAAILALNKSANKARTDHEEEMMSAASEKLEIARGHLGKVQVAWDEPTDWSDLSIYGFYCLEAAVEAAVLHFGLKTSKKHWEKADNALRLNEMYDLPDVSGLLRELNNARKATAYGDVQAPDLDAEDIATEIEELCRCGCCTLSKRRR